MLQLVFVGLWHLLLIYTSIVCVFIQDKKVQESTGTLEQASAAFAAVERIEHAQIALQKKEELVHMERKEVYINALCIHLCSSECH